MSDPVFISLPANTWTIVAASVTSGKIWRANTGPSQYLHTYRDAGNPAPTDRSEGMPIFTDNEPDYEQIKSNVSIDVYVYPVNDAGRVRVDL